jgi:hypothetical protein
LRNPAVINDRLIEADADAALRPYSMLIRLANPAVLTRMRAGSLEPNVKTMHEARVVQAAQRIF